MRNGHGGIVLTTILKYRDVHYALHDMRLFIPFIFMLDHKEGINMFYDLDAWKEGHQLVLEVYNITKDFPKEEQFGVISQVRRAVVSITNNIAEGFGRYHYNDKIKFYYNSKGSTAEVQNLLIISKDLEYISSQECKRLGERSNKVRMLINGLIRSIEKQKK